MRSDRSIAVESANGTPGEGLAGCISEAWPLTSPVVWFTSIFVGFASRPFDRGWLHCFLNMIRTRRAGLAQRVERDKREAFARRSCSIKGLQRHASGNIGARSCLFVGSERIEIDTLRLVRLNPLFNRVAAVNMHQGLHAAGVKMVDMLMA